MSAWSRVRAAGWLVVGGFLLLEMASLLSRASGSMFPGAGVTATLDVDDTVLYVWSDSRTEPDGARVELYRTARSGEEPGPWSATLPEGLGRTSRPVVSAYATRAAATSRAAGAPGNLDVPRYEIGETWVVRVAGVLCRAQAVASGRPRVVRRSGASVVVNQWTAEEGRLVFRGDDGAVAAVVGADGLVHGSDTSAVMPLGDVRHFAGGSWRRLGAPPSATLPPELLHSFGITPAGDVVCVSIEPPEGDGSSRPAEPIAVTVRSVGPRDRPVTPLLPRSGSPRVTREGVLMQQQDRLVVVRADGRVEPVAEIDAANEVIVHVQAVPEEPSPVGDPGAEWRTIDVASLVGPWEPCRTRFRLRRLERGGTAVVRDGEFVPTVPQDYAAVTIRVVAGLARPPLLNAASAASRSPATFEAMLASWWLDPLFAGSRGGACLAVSILTGLLCGAVALRDARRRAPGRAWAWAGTVTLLGPLGLAWMRVVLRRERLEPCSACGARRAVDVDPCPRCSAAWPAPEPRGIAVIA